ncbi:hypothetical protein [Blautia hydrogenotrophica]|uniref:Uncharacterized protein n=1 Tax=Blautia hydrogenotrophica (strain DSM 10507 / JCM 14656 / S5a33) TaxID=476272 RepID=C0CN47_BLAHS|nr:hypothetical protein [Blautia hydrogenotrophica]EEG48835.1 hypothetical protein RUMHYD_02285 [Blautia hydrogenotrophica DSM 10507]MEE0461361.1 hypothetical protein [Blautia hydrogenotrophica]
MLRLWELGEKEHGGLIQQKGIYAGFVLGRKEAISWKMKANQ